MKKVQDLQYSRTLAIGDIHGYWRHLEKLLEFINYNKNTDRLIFLGDYIDRGENSKKTLDLIIDLARENSKNIFLMGNHEDMMLSCTLEDGRLSKIMWLSNGAEETLQSFGVSLYVNLNTIEEKYINFLSFLKHIYIDEELKIIFSHAGIDPLKPPHKQDLLDEFRGPMWIRSDFYNNPKPAEGYKVVFGHSPTFNIKKNHYNILWENHKIGIDTGLCYGFKLSALEIIKYKPFKAYSINRNFETEIEQQPIKEQ